MVRDTPTEGSRSMQLMDKSNNNRGDAVPSPGTRNIDIGNTEMAAKKDFDNGRKQAVGGLMLLWLSFQSCGVIYGDIGTSPLYVFSSTFTFQPSWDDLVGALSIIVWSLIIIVSVKYVCIVLQADDEGQGGTFALYSLLSRYACITKQDVHAVRGVRMLRYHTNDMQPVSRSVRRFLEGSPVCQLLLKLAGIFGVSMVMADGVLTPAQSVLGAIQGIRVVRPDLSTSTIVGITCAILVLLFMVQPMGTSRIGTSFAPIVIIWLLFNLTAGIYNLARYDYTVLKAFSPHYAFAYLVRNGYAGWRSLGGLLLAFTGVEALFADLAAFSKRAIQLSWLCLAFPCLLFAYIGQAAYISQDASGTAFTNPFYNSVPPGTFYFSMVLAVLAAIVASQAMITSTFQLLVQVMRLSYFPHIQIVHTSQRFHEQVYIPLANWLLMIGTIIVTAVYNNTTSLGNAYGVCVIFVTFLTTCMLSLVALIIWRLPAYVVAPVFLIFAALDGAFLSSALTKVPEGAWFTLLLALSLSSIFVLWRFGKETQWAAETRNYIPLSTLLTVTPAGLPIARDGDKTRKTRYPTASPGTCGESASLGLYSPPPPVASSDDFPDDSPNGSPGRSPTPNDFEIVFLTSSGMDPQPISTVPGLGVFFDKGGNTKRLPPCFTHFLLKFAVRPTVVVFFHIHPLDLPTVVPEERYVITCHADTRSNDDSKHLVLPNSYHVSLRHGYAEDPLHPGIAEDIITQIDQALSRIQGGKTSINVDRERAVLNQASQSQVVYLLGKETMRIRSNVHHGLSFRKFWIWPRLLFLELFLWLRENSRAKLADFNVDTNKIIEVGFLTEL